MLLFKRVNGMFKTSSLCEKLWIGTPINFINFCILLQLTVYSQLTTTQKSFAVTVKTLRSTLQRLVNICSLKKRPKTLFHLKYLDLKLDSNPKN